MRTLLVLFVVSLSLPYAANARVFACTAGDTGCIIAAIAKANLDPDRPSLIDLDGSTFTFDRQDNGEDVVGFTATPVIVADLTIRGVGPRYTILARSADLDTPLFRLLHVGIGARVTLEGVTIQGGAVSPVFFNRGGGIFNEGDLTIHEVVITQNAGWIGGGLHTTRDGTQRLRECAVTENTGDFIAGGVTAGGPTTIEGCLIADNIAESGGGIGFDPLAGPIRIKNSILAGNLAFFLAGGAADGAGDITFENTVILDNASGLRGGGISLESGQVTLREVALVGNDAANFGGGLYVISGTVDIRRTTISQNRVVLGGVGGGIFNQQGEITLRNSVLAGNTAPVAPDCAGTIQVAGRTFVGDTTGCNVQR